MKRMLLLTPLTVETHDAVLRIASRYRHIYDALVVAAALEAECMKPYSEDLQTDQVIDRTDATAKRFENLLRVLVGRKVDDHHLEKVAVGAAANEPLPPGTATAKNIGHRSLDCPRSCVAHEHENRTRRHRGR